jgi:hypothetical protein
MKTMKVRKFTEWIKTKKDKVLSLTVTYYDETLIWRPECGTIFWDRGVQAGEIYPHWTLEDALRAVEGGKVHIIFSDLGEVTLRLRP